MSAVTRGLYPLIMPCHAHNFIFSLFWCQITNFCISLWISHTQYVTWSWFLLVIHYRLTKSIGMYQTGIFMKNFIKACWAYIPLGIVEPVLTDQPEVLKVGKLVHPNRWSCNSCSQAQILLVFMLGYHPMQVHIWVSSWEASSTELCIDVCLTQIKYHTKTHSGLSCQKWWNYHDAIKTTPWDKAVCVLIFPLFHSKFFVNFAETFGQVQVIKYMKSNVGVYHEAGKFPRAHCSRRVRWSMQVLCQRQLTYNFLVISPCDL